MFRQPGGRNFLCPVMLVYSVLYSLPEGWSLNSVCLGCEASAEMLPAHFLTLDQCKFCMEGRSAPTIFFCRRGCPLQSVPVLFGCRAESDSDECAEKGQYHHLELHQKLLKQVELPELLQEGQTFLGLFLESVYVGGPLHVLRDWGPQKPESVHTVLLRIVGAGLWVGFCLLTSSWS